MLEFFFREDQGTTEAKKWRGPMRPRKALPCWIFLLKKAVSFTPVWSDGEIMF